MEHRRPRAGHLLASGAAGPTGGTSHRPACSAGTLGEVVDVASRRAADNPGTGAGITAGWSRLVGHRDAGETAVGSARLVGLAETAGLGGVAATPQPLERLDPEGQPVVPWEEAGAETPGVGDFPMGLAVVAPRGVATVAGRSPADGPGGLASARPAVASRSRPADRQPRVEQQRGGRGAGGRGLILDLSVRGPGKGGRSGVTKPVAAWHRCRRCGVSGCRSLSFGPDVDAFGVTGVARCRCSEPDGCTSGRAGGLGTDRAGEEQQAQQGDGDRRQKPEGSSLRRPMPPSRRNVRRPPTCTALSPTRIPRARKNLVPAVNRGRERCDTPEEEPHDPRRLGVAPELFRARAWNGEDLDRLGERHRLPPAAAGGCAPTSTGSAPTGPASTPRGAALLPSTSW